MACCRRGAGVAEIDGEHGYWFPWVVCAAVLGNVLECYLIAAFQGLSDEVFASLLPVEPFGSPTGVFFGVGLTVRYFAGCVVGRAADRKGVARVLQASCVGLGGSALLLGLLPAYSFLGFATPVCFAILWFIGAFIGSAQLPAAALLAFDLAPRRWRGLCSGLVLGSSYFGACCSSLVVLLLRNFKPASLSLWRLVFTLGAVLGAFTFCLQRCLLPTSAELGRIRATDAKQEKRAGAQCAAVGLACAGWMMPAHVPARWLPAFLSSHVHVWSSLEPRLLLAVVQGHLASLLVLFGLLSDLVGQAPVLASGHLTSLLWPLLLWWMAHAPELFSGFAAYVVLNASLAAAGGPLLAWLIELLSSDMEKRCSRLTNTWNFLQALLTGLAVLTTALLEKPHRGGTLAVGLSCAVAGMAGMRGVLVGLRLNPSVARPSAAAAAYGVVGGLQATSFGQRQDEANGDLEAELEEELVELQGGCGFEAKPSKRPQRQGSPKEDAHELEDVPLADDEDPLGEPEV